MIDELKNLLLPFAKPILSKIHRYKDLHRGEDCYLIGDGVSIKWFDLASFSDKTAIPCGLIPFHDDFEKLDVKYLTVAEPWWFYPTNWTTSPPKKIIRNSIQKAYRETISKYPEKEFFLNLSNYPVLRQENITYLFRDIYDARLPADFITHRINAFHGSLRTSILLAIYMGFDRCYLVGYDYTHVPSRSRHWYEKGQGVFYPLENFNKDFFEIAKEFIDITTITLDGTSDFIDAMTYKEHTGRDPVFRENTEIVDQRYLKVLATWPGYSI
ncbi:MAG: hypothetical protein IH604_07420 [Burkholderiales bacterium]|nr:hypothetical protein [Burkholderiales bacterium]